MALSNSDMCLPLIPLSISSVQSSNEEEPEDTLPENLEHFLSLGKYIQGLNLMQHLLNLQLEAVVLVFHFPFAVAPTSPVVFAAPPPYLQQTSPMLPEATIVRADCCTSLKKLTKLSTSQPLIPQKMWSTKPNCNSPFKQG